ncbi:hypothetical protein BVwin_07210 [Bartonella vinsonii subsp. berkhoffii str. Winnie]|nr:hypothetical protein BVwin_07210 [Bartonella vinsonii subsp. berkhoffii str. Winnie]
MVRGSIYGGLFGLLGGLFFCLFLVVCGGAAHIVDMAAISIPSMVAIIVGNLGVHRGFGSMDFSNRKHSNQRYISSYDVGERAHWGDKHHV